MEVCFISNKEYLKLRIEKFGYKCLLLRDQNGRTRYTTIQQVRHWDQICEKFGITETLDRFVNVEWAQNKYQYYSKNELKNQCITKFHEMATICSELKFDVVIQPLASELDRRVIHYVSSFIASSIYYHMSLLPERQFMFCSDEYGRPYLELNKSEEFSIDISCLRMSLKNDRANSKYLRKVENNKEILHANIINLLNSNFLRYFKSKTHRFLTFNAIGIQKLYERFRKLNELGLTANDLKRKSYIFYTIHQPDEAQTMIRGYHNITEIELLRIISYNLPISKKLVVKLHPRVEHTYSNAFIKELKQIPNLIIAKSREDSLVLARNSMCVFTISSSIWMECLLENIPCFTFGRGAFDAFHPYPYHIGIDTLTDIIQRVEHGFERDLNFDDNLVKSIYRNSFQYERNAFSQCSHRKLGDAILKLCNGIESRKTDE